MAHTTRLLLVTCLALLAATPHAHALDNGTADVSGPVGQNETHIFLEGIHLHLGSDGSEDDNGISTVPYSLDIWTTDLGLTLHHGTERDTWPGTTLVVPVPLIGRVFVPVCTESCPVPDGAPYAITGTLYVSGTIHGQTHHTSMPLDALEQVWPIQRR